MHACAVECYKACRYQWCCNMKVCTSKDTALKYMGHRLLFSEGTSLSSSVNPGMSAIWSFHYERFHCT